MYSCLIKLTCLKGQHQDISLSGLKQPIRVFPVSLMKWMNRYYGHLKRLTAISRIVVVKCILI